jgi:hypothetical protein
LRCTPTVSWATARATPSVAAVMPFKALIDHDLAPMLCGRDATDIEAGWDEMWKALLYVGRGGLAAFAVAGIDVALWDLRGERGDNLYMRSSAQTRGRFAPTGLALICRSLSTGYSRRHAASWNAGLPA